MVLPRLKDDLLDYDSGEELLNYLSMMIEKASSDPLVLKMNRIEKSLTRKLVREFSKQATNASRKAIKIVENAESFNKFVGDRFLVALSKGFMDVEKRTSKRVRRDIDDIYKTGKVKFAQLIDSKSLKKDDELGIGIDFGYLDRLTVESLSGLMDVSIGDHFDKNLKPLVAKTIQEALSQGFNELEAAKLLKSKLTEITGAKGFASVPASIRAKGQAATNNYFKMLTATNVTFARNFAHIQHSDELGFEKLRYTAIIDGVTSKICRQMHGTVFTIQQTKLFRDKVLSAKSVNDLKTFSPWVKSLDKLGIRSDNIAGAEKARILAANGVIVPPLHGFCRSLLLPA